MTQPVLSSPFDMPPPRRRLPAVLEASVDHRLLALLLAIAGAAVAVLIGLSLP